MVEKVKKHRDYQNKMPSVTQILGVLRKIALENWFKVNTAEFCNRESAKGKKVGTQIHDAIEQHILTGTASIDSEYADEVMNALNSFILFKKENPSIELKLSEVALTSEKYGFNGTIDAPNPPLLIDWKTGNAKDDDAPKIYDEHKYQVSAYVFLWNELNDVKIDSAKIVCFAKDKVAYSIYDMEYPEIEQCFINVFLPCLSIYNYQKGVK
jgi:hypothetical protein